MSPTLQVGEVHPVFSSDTFNVNDVVTYHPPSMYSSEKVVWVHRLVGIPGDTLEMKEGVLLRNDIVSKPELTLKHSYIITTSMPLTKKSLEGFEYDILTSSLFSKARENP